LERPLLEIQLVFDSPPGLVGDLALAQELIDDHARL
jgi:hypothetical protein